MSIPQHLLLFFAAIFLLNSCSDSQHARQGQPEESPTIISPRLLIVGGGKITPSVHETFLEMAGPNPTLVLITSASTKVPNPDSLKKLWAGRGFDLIHIIHTNEPDYKLTPESLEALDRTTAVWFNGGSQGRLAKSHGGTLLEEKLYAFLEQGGLVGGTSAGAAVQSKVMIARGDEEPKMATGFDFLPDSIIDQHFIARGRLPRLKAAIGMHPELTGYGIDESTALVVEGDQLRVAGESIVQRVTIVDGEIQVESFKAGETIQ